MNSVLKIVTLILLVVALIASVNWAASVYKVDLVATVLNLIGGKTDKERVASSLNGFQKIVYTVVGIAGAVGAGLAIMHVASMPTN